MFRTTNPTMKAEVFENETLTHGEPMTLSGTIGKAGMLLVLLMMGASVGWVMPNIIAFFVCLAVGFLLALAVTFKKEWSPVAAPVYALVEGYFVGTLSVIVTAMLEKTAYGNAVPLAIFGTMITFAVMLGLYVTRIIRVTETLKSVIIGATAAVFITYLGSWIMSMFLPKVWELPIYGNGWIGIGFSVFVIALAAFNLLLDFDLIEKGVENRAPKYMEWYAGFGLLVTLVWLYIEILRLIMKLARR